MEKREISRHKRGEGERREDEKEEAAHRQKKELLCCTQKAEAGRPTATQKTLFQCVRVFVCRVGFVCVDAVLPKSRAGIMVYRQL